MRSRNGVARDDTLARSDGEALTVRYKKPDSQPDPGSEDDASARTTSSAGSRKL